MIKQTSEPFPLAPAFSWLQVVGIGFWYIVILTVMVMIGIGKIPGFADWFGPIVGVVMVWVIVERTSNVGFIEAYELKPDATKFRQLLFTGFKYGFVLISIQVLIISIIMACIMHAGKDLPNEPAYKQLLSWKDSTEFFSKYALIAIVAPFNEELLARGLIFAGLRKTMNFPAACLISSAMFGAAHVYPVHIVVAFFLGVMLCFAVERTRSLIPGLVCHVMLNSAVMFALLGLSMIHSPDSTETKLKNESKKAVQSVTDKAQSVSSKKFVTDRRAQGR